MTARSLAPLVAAALLLAPLTARAGVDDRVPPPAGWQRDADRASRLATFLSKEDHFGGTPIDSSEVAVWSAPEGGATLIVSVVRAPAPAALAVSVRTELEAIRKAPRAAGAVEVSWQESLRKAEHVLEATLAWKDASNQLAGRSRTLVSLREGGIERATAECVVRDDQTAAAAACHQALQALSSAIPAGQRVAFAVPDKNLTPPAPASSDREPPRLGDGSKIAMPTVVVAEKGRDRRPYYVIGALLLAAAALLWNRGRKVARKASQDRDREEAP